MSARESDYTPRPGRITGWHVLAGMVGFFAIVFAVNGLMVYGALSTFDGVEVDGAYQKGRAYNHVLERMEAQEKLGWSAAIEARKHAGYIALSVSFVDAGGKPVEGLDVKGAFWRPVTSGEDVTLALHETAPGTYQGEAALAHDGNWLVRIAAAGTDGETFVEEKRVVIGD